MPELVELHRKWKTKGVRVVALSLDLVLPEDVRSPEELRAFLVKRKFALPVVAFQGDLDALLERYALSGALPSTIIVGRDGTVVGRHEGDADLATFEDLIRAALAL